MVDAENSTKPNIPPESQIDASPPSLDIESYKSFSDQKQEMRLALLKPLAKLDIFEAWRDPNSRQTWQDGTQEYLNIRPLSKAWRQSLNQRPPFPHLTFDLSLPDKDENEKGRCSNQTLY